MQEMKHKINKKQEKNIIHNSNRKVLSFLIINSKLID